MSSRWDLATLTPRGACAVGADAGSGRAEREGRAWGWRGGVCAGRARVVGASRAWPPRRGDVSQALSRTRLPAAVTGVETGEPVESPPPPLSARGRHCPSEPGRWRRRSRVPGAATLSSARGGRAAEDRQAWCSLRGGRGA